MNRLSLFWWMFILLVLPELSRSFAADADTFSPMVSYQFLDSIDEPERGSVGTSPVISYQFLDAIDEPESGGVIVSPIISYQYFDWLGDENLTFQSSSSVSYFYNLASGQDVALLGHVFDFAGAPLPGASIQLFQNGQLKATTIADTSGSYAFANIAAGIYDVECSKADFLKGIRSAVRLQTGQTMSVDFSLTPRPMPPKIQQTRVEPSKELAAPPNAVTSKSEITSTETGNSRPKNITVLTHGWIPSWWPNKEDSGVSGWPKTMKEALLKNARVSTDIDIWDWKEDATAWQPGIALGKASKQGVALAQHLLTRFGTTFDRPLHFVGHSLGALVNAYAATFLEKQGYKTDKLQLTLFDEAEIAKALTEPVDYISEGVVTDNYQPIPVQIPRWVDSFESSPIGFFASVLHRDQAVHIVLLDVRVTPIIVVNPVRLHGYAIEWYQQTILNPDVAPIGFGLSSEINDLSTLPPRGTVFVQALTDEFSFNRFKPDDSVSFDIPASYATEAAKRTYTFIDQNVVQPINNVTASIKAAGRATADWIEAKALKTTFWALRVTLQGARSIGFNRAMRAESADSIQPTYAWIPINIPKSAAMMSFDYEFETSGSGDYVTVGIGTTRLLDIESDFAPPQVTVNSGLADISKWAGQQVDLFIGLFSTNGSPGAVTVKGIRFYQIAAPRLMISKADDLVLLSWPAEAADFNLQTTDILQDGTKWMAVTNTLSLDNQAWQVALQPLVSRKYFRLSRSAP